MTKEQREETIENTQKIEEMYNSRNSAGSEQDRSPPRHTIAETRKKI